MTSGQSTSGQSREHAALVEVVRPDGPDRFDRERGARADLDITRGRVVSGALRMGACFACGGDHGTDERDYLLARAATDRGSRRPRAPKGAGGAELVDALRDAVVSVLGDRAGLTARRECPAAAFARLAASVSRDPLSRETAAAFVSAVAAGVDEDRLAEVEAAIRHVPAAGFGASGEHLASALHEVASATGFRQVVDRVAVRRWAGPDDQRRELRGLVSAWADWIADVASQATASRAQAEAEAAAARAQAAAARTSRQSTSGQSRRRDEPEPERVSGVTAYGPDARDEPLRRYVANDDPGPAVWHRMVTHRFRLSHRVRGDRVSRDWRASRDGVVPSFWHRAVSDGQVFGSMRPMPGGTVLVDVSGSMSWEHDDLARVLASFPGATVALYGVQHSTIWTALGAPKCDGTTDEARGRVVCSDGCRAGLLLIVADRGRMVGESDLALAVGHADGGNGVDGPALAWLARQRRPRVWLSDGAVNGASGAVFADATSLVKSGRIWRAPDVSAALDALRKGR